MKYVIRKNLILILSLLLLGLIFILWGRLLVREIYNESYTHGVTTQAARLACLAHYGWQADPGGESVKTVHIPDPLDATFRAYNHIQTPCGFDLERHVGKNVQCYSYPINNPPDGVSEPVYVNLLIYEGTVIGGDYMSPALNGFMRPLIAKNDR